jgi:hypothetical protein
MTSEPRGRRKFAVVRNNAAGVGVAIHREASQSAKGCAARDGLILF